ncbi:unnamed protein product [Calypogeia fissa]
MALASTSCHLDQPSSNDKQIMVHMNDKLCNDSSLLSSTIFADIDYDAESSSIPLVSEEDLQGFTVTGNRIFAPETKALSLGASAVSTEAAHIMQGREGSYPANQHVPTAHESFGSRLSDENGSLGFNQLPGFAGDVRLYSHEMPTYAALQHQKLGWNEAEQQSFAPRKYQRRRAVGGNVIKDEVTSRRTPWDNVERERKRPDLMTTKIAALDLLLPRSSKRDRVAVVYDAIQLLKSLERDIKDLQKKFHETKLRRAGLAPSAIHRQPLHPVTINVRKPIDCNMRTTGHCFSKTVVIKHTGIYMKPIDILTLSTEGTTGGTTEESRPTQRPSFQCLGASNIPDKGDVFVEFHVCLEDNVRVHEEKLLKCRCRKDYLSTMMGLVEEFQLDIVSCNVVKLSSYFICFMGLKIRTTTKSTNAAQFAFRLQSAVDLDIYESPGKQLQSVSQDM